MASESKAPVELSAIPNSVSGDGTTFVKGLKRYLQKYNDTVDIKIATSGVGQITNITLIEQHVTRNGTQQNDIFVSYNTSNIANFSFAQIWITENMRGEWTLDGISTKLTYTIQNVTAGHTYYVKVIGCTKDEGYSDFDRSITAQITISGARLICNTPTQFYWDNSDRKWKWSGYIDNGYTDYFEIRTDGNPGQFNEHRIDAVPYDEDHFYSTVAPTSRSGTAYLYVRNMFSNYNTPITHTFAISGLPKPSNPILTSSVDGMKVTMQGLPDGATNYIVSVNGEEFEVTTSQWTYYGAKGTTYAVKYCFVDSIGKGEWSNSVNGTSGREIGTADLAANAVTADKIKAYAITANKIATGAITIGGSGREVTISDGAINGSKITAASIVGDKISANSIRGSHLYSDNISLTGALAITGGGVKLDQDGLTLTGSDGSTTTFNEEGIAFKDYGGTLYAQVKKMVMGKAYDGKYIRFNSAWAKPPTVFCSVSDLQVTSASYTASDMYVVCRATNITENGFTVNCYTTLNDGSTGVASPGYNYDFNGFTSFTGDSSTYQRLRTASYTGTSQLFNLPATNLQVEVKINLSGYLTKEKPYESSGGGESDL